MIERPDYMLHNTPGGMAGVYNLLVLGRLKAGTLYLKNSAGEYVEITATPEQLNALGERILVANKTGSSITAGSLVYVNGYDATLDCPTIALADANAQKPTQYVVPVAIANNASGYVEAEYTITGLNTNSASAVGDPVYLSETPGGWTLVAPTAADSIVQPMGVVKVKSATVGAMRFFPGKSFISSIGTSNLQSLSVSLAKVEASLTKGISTVPMSFESGEQAAVKVYFPFKVTINKIRGIATKAIAGTDNGTITGANATGNSASGVVTAVASDAINTEYSVSPTTNNVVEADSYYKFTAAKSTAGGKVLITIEWTRTA